MYRLFFLLPSARTRRLVSYCLAYVSDKYSVEIHEFIFLSNHYHLVVTDPLGELPCFMRDLNSLLARSLNASLGRWEAVWSSESYCAPVLCDGDDILDKCIYTLCNINSAGLVRHVANYEGVSSWSMEYGERRRFERPDEEFFSSHMPKSVDLALVRPRSTRPELSDRELRAEIRRIVRSQEIANAHRLRAKGGTFLGMKRLLRQRTTDSPGSRAPRRGIRPRVAGRSIWARLEALQRNKTFDREYWAAWKLFHGGDRSVVFPYGTYKLRVDVGVRCRPPP